MEKFEFASKYMVIPEDVPEDVWRPMLKSMVKAVETVYSSLSGDYLIEIEVLKGFIVFYREAVRLEDQIYGLDVVMAPKNTEFIVKYNTGLVRWIEVDDKNRVRILQEDIQAL